MKKIKVHIPFSLQIVSLEVSSSIVFWVFLGGAEVSWPSLTFPTLSVQFYLPSPTLSEEGPLGCWAAVGHLPGPPSCPLPCSVLWLQGCWSSPFIFITASIFEIGVSPPFWSVRGSDVSFPFLSICMHFVLKALLPAIMRKRADRMGSDSILGES